MAKGHNIVNEKKFTQKPVKQFTYLINDIVICKKNYIQKIKKYIINEMALILLDDELCTDRLMNHIIYLQ